MNHCRILNTCLICLFIAACDNKERSTPVPEITKTQIVPEKTRPPLDLSLDNIDIKPQENNDADFLSDKTHIEEDSDLFKALNKDQTESKIDISGKLLTDEEKLENREYLESIEGVQINVEGNFE